MAPRLAREDIWGLGMKRSIAASLAVAGLALGLTASAFAADKPVYLKAPVAPWSWTGFYLGANVGYSWGKSNTTVSFLDAGGNLVAADTHSLGLNGVIGGGQLGYNWQNGNWVLGLETDIQASGQKGSSDFTCPIGVCKAGVAVTETLNQKLDWFGTARGRIGFTITPTILLYGTGGLAYGDIKTDGTISDPTTFSVSTVKAGWTVGAGIEGRISGNWTAKLEYLYMDLGNVSGGLVSTPAIVPQGCTNLPRAAPCTLGTTFSSTGSGVTDNILRVGVNYKFN
jgi:outer membrane immunogenic protein